MNRTQVESEINFYIKTNGVNSITGVILNTILKLITGNFVSKESDIALLGLKEHSPSVPYKAGDGVIKTGVIYQANVDNTGAFNGSQWTARSTNTVTAPPQEFTFTTNGSAQEYIGTHTFNNVNLGVTIKLDKGSGVWETVALVCEFTATTWKAKFFTVPATGQVYKGCLTGVKI